MFAYHRLQEMNYIQEIMYITSIKKRESVGEKGYYFLKKSGK